MKEIMFAGGCFWGTQEYFNRIKGILKTEVGYVNGKDENATYQKVCKGSGHAEVVNVFYDENIIKIEELFNLFLNSIDPFTKNRQGNDKGVQYRSGIYSKDEQTLKKVSTFLKNWESINGKSAIEVLKIENYTKAEEVHQNYLKKTPNGYCHIDFDIIPTQYRKAENE